MSELGKWIRARLDETERTVADLADAMGIDESTLGAIIGGDIKRPPDARLSAIARFFDVSVDLVRSKIAGDRLEEGKDIRQGGTPSAGSTVRMFGGEIEIVRSAFDTQASTVENLLLPDGRVTNINGETTVIDRESAERVIAAFKSQGRHTVIDYEHASMRQPPPADGSGVAAGWITRMRYEPGVGLFGGVRWTSRARERIRGEEFRYLSPYVLVDPKTRRVVKYVSAGLVQNPATPGGLPVAAADRNESERGATLSPPSTEPNTGETRMDFLNQLRQLLGLGEDADEAAVVQAIEAIKESLAAKKEPDADETPSAGDQVASAVRKELGLKDDAKVETVMAAYRIKAGAGSADATALATLRGEVAAMKDAEADRRAMALVDEYVACNKINPRDPNHVASCVALAKSDPSGFKSVMAGVNPYALPGRTTAPAIPAYGSTAASKEDEMIASSLKAHDGNHGASLVALQGRLMKERKEQGYSHDAAATQLEHEYPKIFG